MGHLEVPRTPLLARDIAELVESALWSIVFSAGKPVMGMPIRRTPP